MTPLPTLAELHDELHACRACPRLVAWREEVAHEKRAAYRLEAYWGRPISGSATRRRASCSVGWLRGPTAPTARGASSPATAREIFCSPACTGLACPSQPAARHRDDGLALADCYLTSCVRCLPARQSATAQ